MQKRSTRKLAEILLVEDNPGDIRLMQEAIKEDGLKTHLNVVRSGEEALAFLRHEGEYARSPRPTYIILDLNMPGKDGRQVLAEIKRDEGLRLIPVMVFSTSTSAEDIRAAYDLHANCYIPKPVDLDDLLRVNRVIEEFWLRTAVLPA